MLVHGIASLFILAGAAGARKPVPPTYKVRLIAAPAPTDEERKAPEAVERPAEEKPAPVPTKKPPPKSTAAKEAPPKTADDTKREAAPRTTPKTAPLPGETPSTGSDVATVSTEGVEFPFPEYLQNIVGQVLRRWQRPLQSTPLEAEAAFLVHRDHPPAGGPPRTGGAGGARAGAGLGARDHRSGVGLQRPVRADPAAGGRLDPLQGGCGLGAAGPPAARGAGRGGGRRGRSELS